MRRKTKLVFGVGVNDADYQVYWKHKCQLAKELAALQTNKVVADRLLELYKEY